MARRLVLERCHLLGAVSQLAFELLLVSRCATFTPQRRSLLLLLPPDLLLLLQELFGHRHLGPDAALRLGGGLALGRVKHSRYVPCWSLPVTVSHGLVAEIARWPFGLRLNLHRAPRWLLLLGLVLAGTSCGHQLLQSGLLRWLDDWKLLAIVRDDLLVLREARLVDLFLWLRDHVPRLARVQDWVRYDLAYVVLLLSWQGQRCLAGTCRLLALKLLVRALLSSNLIPLPVYAVQLSPFQSLLLACVWSFGSISAAVLDILLRCLLVVLWRVLVAGLLAVALEPWDLLHALVTLLLSLQVTQHLAHRRLGELLGRLVDSLPRWVAIRVEAHSLAGSSRACDLGRGRLSTSRPSSSPSRR